MSLFEELKKRYEATGFKGLDSEELAERKAAKEKADELNRLVTRKQERIFGLTLARARAVFFEIVRSFCANNGSFYHTDGHERALIDEKHHYDGMQVLCRELKIKVGMILEKLPPQLKANGVTAKVATTCLARAYCDIFLASFLHRGPQATVVRHSVSSVAPAEAEIVFADAGKQLDKALAGHKLQNWQEVSESYLCSSLGYASKSDLDALISECCTALEDVREAISSHAANTPNHSRRVSVPSVRAMFLTLRTASSTTMALKAEQATEWPLDIHGSAATIKELSNTEAFETHELREEEKQSSTGGVEWHKPVLNCTVCVRDEEECGVKHHVTLKRVLGSGTSGTVVAGEWQGTECALKVFHSHLLSDEEDETDKFLDELDIMNHIQHPHCLPLIAANIAPPNYCMVMPLCRRGDLYELLHEKKVNIEFGVRLTWAKQIASAVDYLHRHLHVIHRDLKSLNVMLDSDSDDVSTWVVKIADYGTSRFLHPAAVVTNHIKIGTPVYMSPELLLQKPYTYPVDIFALGVLLAELFTGVEPYAEEIEAAGSYEPVVEEVAKNGKRPDLTGAQVPVWLSELLEKMWSEEPVDRPSAAEVLATLSAH